MPSSDEGDHGSREPIAIVGISFEFAQNLTSENALWKLLLEGRTTDTKIPSSRMNIDAFYNRNRKGLDTLSVDRGHFLGRDIGVFDAPFFSISPAEAATMDPQQRLLLETSYRALENAGLGLEDVNNSNTSVFTGCFSDDYRLMYAKDPEQFSQYGGTGIANSLLANRLSWFYNFSGTSMNVDTACSSGLIALDLACHNLLNGESDMAMVAGCNLLFSPDLFLAYDNLSLLSPDGRSYSFDQRANGYSRGEGFAVLIIKRLADALENGDNIRAVIRSTGANQNGFSATGITQTNQKRQEALIKETYKKAGLDMGLTKFVEAHGTGTKLGDARELNALGNAFRTSRVANDLFV
ncbi:hypothetical protein NHQ30_010844 [Ciborinia camelliae]|nr:hypothetical protein NHQ30_010844 [Ciborinia camelliae]